MVRSCNGFLRQSKLKEKDMLSGQRGGRLCRKIFKGAVRHRIKVKVKQR